MPHRKHSLWKRRITLLGGFVYCLVMVMNYLPYFRSSDTISDAVLTATAHGYLLPVYVFMWALAGLACVVNLKKGKLIIPLSFVCGMLAGWGMIWFISFDYKLLVEGVFDLQQLKQCIWFWGPMLMVGSLVTLTPRFPESILDLEMTESEGVS